MDSAEWKRGENNNGFKIPSNYFSELETAIQSQISLSDFSKPDSNGFGLPNNYFSDLDIQIAENIHNSSVKQNGNIRQLRIKKMLKYVSAASVVIIAGAWLYTNNLNSLFNNSDKSSSSDNLVAEQMLFDIDERLIIDHIRTDQEPKLSSSVDPDALESYILNNFSNNELASSL